MSTYVYIYIYIDSIDSTTLHVKCTGGNQIQKVTRVTHSIWQVLCDQVYITPVRYPQYIYNTTQLYIYIYIYIYVRQPSCSPVPTYISTVTVVPRQLLLSKLSLFFQLLVYSSLRSLLGGRVLHMRVFSLTNCKKCLSQKTFKRALGIWGTSGHELLTTN